VLEAEASGRLKEQHTFLYAMAADLRVVDISKLLTEYKVRAPGFPCIEEAVMDCAIRSGWQSVI
jgi:hypothetical protein